MTEEVQKLSGNGMDTVDTYYDLLKNPMDEHGQEGYSRMWSMFKNSSGPSCLELGLSKVVRR